MALQKPVSIGDLADPVPTSPQAIAAGPAGAPVEAPTTDPQEIEVRKSGWARFLTELQSNTKLQQSLLSTGTNLLQPRRGGQTSAGAIGQGIAAGQKTFQDLTQQETAEGQATTALEIQQQNANAQSEIARAQGVQADANVGLTETRSSLIDAQIDQIEASLDPDLKRLQKEQISADILQAASQAEYYGALAASGGSSLPASTRAFNSYLAAIKTTQPELSNAEATIETHKFFNIAKTTKTPQELYSTVLGSLIRTIDPLAMTPESFQAEVARISGTAAEIATQFATSTGQPFQKPGQGQASPNGPGPGSLDPVYDTDPVINGFMSRMISRMASPPDPQTLEEIRSQARKMAAGQ